MVLKHGHKVDQKYLESFEMRCSRRVELIWIDHVKNEVLHTVKEEKKNPTYNK